MDKLFSFYSLPNRGSVTEYGIMKRNHLVDLKSTDANLPLLIKIFKHNSSIRTLDWIGKNVVV